MSFAWILCIISSVLLQTDLCPPLHMPIAYGPVVIKKTGRPKGTASQASVQDDDPLCVCSLCCEVVQPSEKITCLYPGCLLAAHIICLAKSFLKKDSFIIPIEGSCPACNTHVLWADLVRKKRGCYKELMSTSNDFLGDSDWKQCSAFCDMYSFV
jgi:structure-specific endonuclease subunit SLX1